MQILRFSSALLGWLILTVFTVPALAHVSITPRTAQTGVRHVRHILRAPVEKEISVVELGIEVSPEWHKNGGDLGFSESISGWTPHREFDEDGKAVRLWWTGEAIPETFQMIYFTLNIPEKPGVYPFKSWQKYSDGSVVWWNEPRGEGVKNPYPIVTVERPPLLTAGIVQVSSTAIALLALGISLLSFRNNRKNHAPG